MRSCQNIFETAMLSFIISALSICMTLLLKNVFICFNESTLKMIKNAFSLEALFVPKIFAF